MGRSVNKFICLGNVGKAPEVRSTAGGTVVANFSIALSDRKKDAQGDWVDSVEWVNCVAFKRTAEIVRDYVLKGSKVYVEGKLQTSSWEDKQSGEKRYKTEVLVNDLVLLSSKEEGGGHSEGYKQKSAPANQYDQSGDIDPEDLPF